MDTSDEAAYDLLRRIAQKAVEPMLAPADPYKTIGACRDELMELIKEAVSFVIERQSVPPTRLEKTSFGQSRMAVGVPIPPDKTSEKLAAYRKSQDDAAIWLCQRVDKLVAEVQLLRSVLDVTHKLVVDAALTGFNPHDGTWAERLYANQSNIHEALKTP